MTPEIKAHIMHVSKNVINLTSSESEDTDKSSSNLSDNNEINNERILKDLKKNISQINKKITVDSSTKRKLLTAIRMLDNRAMTDKRAV